MLIACGCAITSLFIPAGPAHAPTLRINRNVFASTLSLLRELKQDSRLWNGGLAVSCFWVTGAISLALVPVVVRNRTGGGIEVETAISACFAIGIAIGSLGAAILAKGRIYLKLVPVAALGMGLFLLDLGWGTAHLQRPAEDIGLMRFLTSFTGLHIMADVIGLAMSAGLFVVPLLAAIQFHAQTAHRARVVAGVNILNSLFMVSATAVTAFLQSPLAGLQEPVLLMILGVFDCLVAVVVRRHVRSVSLRSDEALREV
jgi:acyl-[acyl-carrier-protein]-phospholipid O-acyltransferase/long-chain-fatty-acid--[acyl-carrier-protein] ligase